MHSLIRGAYRQIPTLFLWTPVLLGTGIAIYFSTSGPPPRWVLITIGGIAAGLIPGAVQRRYLLLRLTCLTAIWLMIGYGLAAIRAAMVAAPILAWNYYGPIEGRVVAIDRSASNAPRIVLDQVRLPGARGTIPPTHVRLSAVDFIAPGVLTAGAIVTTTGYLSPPQPPVEPGGFDFRRFAWFAQLGAVGYTRNPLIVLRATDPKIDIKINLLAMRMQVADWASTGIGGTSGGFAAAIIAGDRSEIDPTVTQTLRTSNLAHLLAISGLHMGLLSGFVFVWARLALLAIPGLALRRPIKKYAAAIALVGAFLYLLLSGGNVATQRAFVMSAVVLCAVILDRPALTLRAVALAAIIVIVISPESVLEAGFQMSFAATTGLVAAYQALRGRGIWAPGGGRARRYLAGAAGVVTTSAIGGLSTAPFSAIHFNTISQFGLLANVLAVPMMGLVVMPAAVIAAVLAPLGLDHWPLAVMGAGIDWILAVAAGVSALPGAARGIVAPPDIVLPLVTFGGLMLCLMLGRARLLGALPLVIAGAIWALADRPTILIDPQGRVMGAMTDQGRSVNKSTAYAYVIRTWLENDGDLAPQQTAFARAGLTPTPDGISAQLASGHSVYLFWGKSAPEFTCASGDIVIFTRQDFPMSSDCRVMGTEQREQAGAIAILDSAQGGTIVPTLSPSQRHYWQRP